MKYTYSDVCYIVEANSFERLRLWETFHKKSENPVSWDEHLNSFITVGHIQDRPICISIFIILIDKKPVLFFEATSELVDFNMIDKWLKKETPQLLSKEGYFQRKTDAQNFHNCVHHLRTIDSKKYQLQDSLSQF